MPIPDYETIMLPLLRFMSDGEEHAMREVIEHLANEFNLSDDERKTLLPSGGTFKFATRVSWARTYLKKAGLLESPRRAYIQITDRGKSVMAKNPARVDNNFLMQFEEFVQFRNQSRPVSHPDDLTIETSVNDEKTPEEQLQTAYERLKTTLADDVLEQVTKCTPAFFEKLVVELLVRMGYGGSLKDAGQAVGRSGDEGIDGLIKEDKLGLDTVYIQAKRWQNTVGRPELQRFVGALQGKRARKGVFITTSDFTRDAIDYTNNIDIKIALIDGQTLAKYMIDFDIGVSRVSTYEVKRVDTDYFWEE
jgi:restriction system protein